MARLQDGCAPTNCARPRRPPSIVGVRKSLRLRGWRASPPRAASAQSAPSERAACRARPTSPHASVVQNTTALPIARHGPCLARAPGERPAAPEAPPGSSIRGREHRCSVRALWRTRALSMQDVLATNSRSSMRRRMLVLTWAWCAAMRRRMLVLTWACCAAMRRRMLVLTWACCAHVAI